MPIPVYIRQAITREHVLSAMRQLRSESIAPRNDSTIYDVVSPDGEHYPPKLVVSQAAELAIGTKLPVGRFHGGPQTNTLLRNLGFEIALKSTLSIKELRVAAEREGCQTPATITTTTTHPVRNVAVAAYVKALADGHCDLCEARAPFECNGSPYLECHHVIYLSEKGPDTINNTVAVCPNCHRRIHALKDLADLEKLKGVIASRR